MTPLTEIILMSYILAGFNEQQSFILSSWKIQNLQDYAGFLSILNNQKFIINFLFLRDPKALRQVLNTPIFKHSKQIHNVFHIY